MKLLIISISLVQSKIQMLQYKFILIIIMRKKIVPYLDQTRVNHREVPDRAHLWVSWYDEFVPCSGDQDSGLRDNRRFSHPQWRPQADNWNSLWRSSTIWCYTAACLIKTNCSIKHWLKQNMYLNIYLVSKISWIKKTCEHWH